MIKDKTYELPKNLSFDESIIENIKNNISTSFLSHSDKFYMTNLFYLKANNNSNITNKIQIELKNMIKNKCIYLNDIPQIIFNLASLIKINVIQNNEKNINIANIIRYILEAFFVPSLLPLNDREIDEIKRMIYSSIRLLQLNVNVN